MLWEYEFLSRIQELHTPVLDKIMAFLSLLGDHGYFWIGLCILLLIFRKTRPAGIQVMLAIIVTYIIGNMILKNLIDRPRPYVVYEALKPLGSLPNDPSFPSGHTMNGFTSAVSIFMHNKKAGAAALILAALIAVSRLYNLVHFPTDVIGGLIVGIGCAIIIDRVMKVRRSRKAQKI